MIDCVVSAHDSDLCGVSRFNRKLAEKLGVPHRTLADIAYVGNHPLISIKGAEVRNDAPPNRPYDLFLHDCDYCLHRWVREATRVYAANPEIPAWFRGAEVLWCPETLGHAPYPLLRAPSDQITVFATGMAHKAQWEKHKRLRAWLDEQEMPWWALVSSGFHEGRDLEDDMRVMRAGLSDVYGERGIYLGFLSDQMTRSMMASATMVAAFFDGGLRQNNTTAMAALRMGCPLVTHVDEFSPMVPCFDLDRLPPYERKMWREMGREAELFMRENFTWDGLVAALTAERHAVK